MEECFVVVDANGEVKRRGRFDTGEYDTYREAERYRQTLNTPDDYVVLHFRTDGTCRRAV